MRYASLLFKINIYFIFLSLLFSCKKLTEAGDPKDKITDENVFKNEQSAISALSGIYITMGDDFSGIESISAVVALSPDELNVFPGTTRDMQVNVFQNSINVLNGSIPSFWKNLYNYIFRCNTIIQGIEASKELAPNAKNQLLGEAKLLRGFFYYYIVNLYGNASIVLTNRYKENINLSRADKLEVYHQILADLKDAKDLLSDQYLDGDLHSYQDVVEKVRPSKWVASALLARVYLSVSQWHDAEEEASAIINNTDLFALSPINKVFLKNSSEAIWQIQPSRNHINTNDAVTFIIPATGPGGTTPFYLSNQLLSSFENNDKRALPGNWIDSLIYKPDGMANDTLFYPYKYKNNSYDDHSASPADLTEYIMVLRLSEQYLIRAEARAQQNIIEGSRDDLNMVRARAGLSGTAANDQPGLINAITHERQVELFTEWGHRWIDLKRTGTVDEVMKLVTPLKAPGTEWKSYQQLYPLPLDDLRYGPNLRQNDGY
jgi:starch-binding outer membrane protein, SusD/RagB family